MVLHYGGRADIAPAGNVSDGGGIAPVIEEFADEVQDTQPGRRSAGHYLSFNTNVLETSVSYQLAVVNSLINELVQID
jgi:hypothetical protein